MQKNKLTKTFFVTGGGTGGHIYPAVSILNELKKAGYEKLFYIGNKNNPEFGIAKGLELEFLDVPVFGMPRRISFRLIKWVFLLAFAVLKCLNYARKFKPDAVFATGGYVSAPMVIAAKILKIPYIMHDSDAHPGIVTKSFAADAAAINLAFEGAEKFIKNIKKERIYHFKNPVRSEFFSTSVKEAREQTGLNDEFTILIMGGSQGAKTVNGAALKLIERLQGREDVKIILQTGKKNYEEVKAKIGKLPANLILQPYFDKMHLPIISSNLVVSRAGSLSISEILAAKKPSILVPYPFAAADHQRKNAREIEKIGACIYIEDNELEEKLVPVVEELLENREKLAELAKNAAEPIKENPTNKILKLILEVVNEA